MLYPRIKDKEEFLKSIKHKILMDLASEISKKIKIESIRDHQTNTDVCITRFFVGIEGIGNETIRD